MWYRADLINVSQTVPPDVDSSWVSDAVIVASVAMSGMAIIALIFAIRKGSAKLRPMWTAQLILAIIYHLSYWWLVFNTERAAAWSLFLRPVGVMSWPAVWAWPAIAVTRLSHRVASSISQMAPIHNDASG